MCSTSNEATYSVILDPEVAERVLDRCEPETFEVRYNGDGKVELRSTSPIYLTHADTEGLR